MVSCEELTTEILERLVSAGFKAVLFMIILVIIASIVENRFKKFKNRLYREYIDKNKL